MKRMLARIIKILTKMPSISVVLRKRMRAHSEHGLTRRVFERKAYSLYCAYVFASQEHSHVQEVKLLTKAVGHKYISYCITMGEIDTYKITKREQKRK